MTASVKAPELLVNHFADTDTRPGAMTSAVRFFSQCSVSLLLSADKSGYALPPYPRPLHVMLFLHEAVPRFLQPESARHNSPCFVDIFRMIKQAGSAEIKTSAPAAISFS